MRRHLSGKVHGKRISKKQSPPLRSFKAKSSLLAGTRYLESLLSGACGKDSPGLQSYSLTAMLHPCGIKRLSLHSTMSHPLALWTSVQEAVLLLLHYS
jgi:hypothetical protein